MSMEGSGGSATGVVASISRSMSTKCKKKHFKPKHQKSKLFRANEPLLSVFMWGVNHTINELNHVNIPVMLMPDDFKAFTKVRVDNHLYQKDIMPSHFKVKEYCPLVFRNLRERFSIDDSDYLKSLTKFQPVAVDKEQSASSGRPAKLYSSYDNQLILKTLSTEEVENMHHLLKEYHPYVVERFGKTLLPQYLGLYRLTVEGQETHIVVMRNIFNSRLTIHKKYDLKGSNLDREASEKERSKDFPCYKDNDFIKDGIKLYLDLDSKQKLLSTLEADTAFLARENLMDYSLLLGIHDCERFHAELAEINSPKSTSSNDDDDDANEFDGTTTALGGSGAGGDSIFMESARVIRATQGDNAAVGVMSSASAALAAGAPLNISSAGAAASASLEKQQIYFMGLVDVLTQFGLRKRIVTVHPEQYRKRLMEFIAKAIVCPTIQ